MDPIEKAIRTAFEKGDPSDPAFREKVYRSAASALDRALKANPNTTVERAIARRRTLESTVAAIEAEHLAPAAEPEAPDWDFSVGNERADAGSAAAPAVSLDDRRASTRRTKAARAELSFDADETFEPRFETRDEAGNETLAADPNGRRKRRTGSWLAGLMLSLVFLGLLGAGGWWLVSSGLLPVDELLGLQSTQTADGQDSTTGEEESVAGPLSENQETREWINIFNPQDPSTVSVPSGADASVQTSEGLKLLRVRSGAPGEPIRFAVGKGVLEQLAGKKAVFDIVARADTEDGGNFSVACDFGKFGDCGRRRYAATAATRADFLLEVELPAGAAPADGMILIDPDVTGGGKALDIFEIRAAPSE